MTDNNDFDAEELFRHSIESIPVSEDDYLVPVDDGHDFCCEDLPFIYSQDSGLIPQVSPSGRASGYAYPAAVAPEGRQQNSGYASGGRQRSGDRQSSAGSSSDVTYLNVPFSEKDEAKSLGARWDKNVKKWYVPAGVALEDFSRWM